MNFSTTLLIGFKEIWAHKFRSLLTMLGIILGVSSLVAMSAMVKGMENGMKEALIAIGGLEKISVEPQAIPAYQKHLADDAMGVTMNDVYALQKSAPLIRLIQPTMGMRQPTLTRAGKSFNPWVCVGTWPSALEMNEHVVQYGRMFNDIDDEQARSVCVIGTAVRDALFGDPEETGKEIVPLGERININGRLFTIIGMFEHYEGEQEKKQRLLAKAAGPAPAATGPARRRGGGGNNRRGSFVFYLKNATVYMPLNTMWVKFRTSSGTNNIPDPRLTVLNLKIADVEKMEPALQQARNVLMQTHKGVEDFTFRTQESWAENITTSIRNARMSGGIIAAISLIVGGIGIMNIMFASITERIREIGIRKAIGATTFAVFIQILVESLAIAVLGGMAGLVTSFGLVRILVYLSPGNNAPQITAFSMLIAFVFSAGVGVLAGILPAIKAARLDPIAALRYE
jgi:putative ABC transport system permease protein